MNKIRHKLKNESVQAGLVITGFFVMFAILAIFFFNK